MMIENGVLFIITISQNIYLRGTEDIISLN